MEEYLIPPINGQKNRNLTYQEIEWLIKTITDAEHKSPDTTRLKKAIEKTKEMFTVTSVMVLVKAGTFQMGDEHGDLWDACRPVHTVKLTYDYYIGKYEVTFNEYDAYCEDTGK
ncbi:MAG TPA: SUMF1/EgtB/PvdO family nonheme iron enzyme, partial [Thermotogota bacterium]|nr:SUMF1/EgtB/PvdO family nonheme iron enzyme [Thermotogota bacterium]